MLLNVLSRVLGFLREAAVAFSFGATASTDAYLIAMLIPSILFKAAHDAVRSAFIPVFGQYKSGDEGIPLVNTSALALAAILLAAAVGGVIFAPALVRVIAPGFTGETFALSVTLTRILLPAIVFLGLSSLATGYLHSYHSFLAPSLTGVPFNLIIIFSALFIGSRFGIVGLAWGSLVGFASQFFIQLPAVFRAGFQLRWKFDWRNAGVRRIGALLPPIMVGSAAMELKQVVDRMFGSLLPAGSVAALNFADRLFVVPHNIFVHALVTVLYPALVDIRAAGRMDEFRGNMRRGLAVITFLILPVTVGSIVLAEPIVRLLFQRGAFDAAATRDTAYALAFYSAGMLGVSARYFLERCFFVLEDTRTPMLVTVGAVALNVLLNWLLFRPLAHGGIALATAISSVLAAALLYYLMRTKVGRMGGKRLLLGLIRSAAAAAVMGLALYYAWGAWSACYAPAGFIKQAFQVGSLIGAGALVYFAVSLALRAEEISWAKSYMRRAWKRLARSRRGGASR